MADLHDLTALEQGAAIRRGQVSPAELAEHYLARISAHNSSLGAFVTVAPDASGSGRGPLAGVPVAVKDLTLTAGVRTTFGSAAFAEYVPSVDADVVVLMRQAGLVSLGKTATSEFGLSLYAETDIAPATRNPWDTSCTAGGSSGGAAAAVAAGLVPFAQGNDGGGSLRIPASICGVVGYKPSRGLVSGGPLGFGGFGLPTNGPIARTVTDAAALLDILSQPVPGEPYLTPARPGPGFLDAARHPDSYLPKGRPVRIGRYIDPLLADITAAPDVVAVWEQTSARLAGLGCEVFDVDPPLGRSEPDDFRAIWSVLSLSPIPADKETLLRPLTRWLRDQGRSTSVEQLLVSLAALQVKVRRHARATAYDILLSPTLARPQARVGFFAGAPDPATDFDRQTRFSPYCAAYNITGQPAVSLPLGAAAADDPDGGRVGSPIGVMLAAAPGADALLIAVAAWLEAAAPWVNRHPPVWSQPG